jgi:hypothetical protein
MSSFNSKSQDDMFKRQLIGLTLLWLISVFVCFWIFHTFSPNAQIAYQRLMNVSDDDNTDQIHEKASLTQQTRFQVSKQILYKKDEHRLQSRLMSEHSELSFDPKGERKELVERFKSLVGVMQEKLMDTSKNEERKDSSLQSSLESKQYIRCLKANEAVYSYKTGLLEAGDVEVVHYLIPGLLWPLSLEPFSPLLKGRAQKLQLSLFQEMTFKAQGFQASFYDWRNE